MPAIPPHKTATTTDAWNESENEDRIANDAGESVLREFFAWVEANGDATTKSAYKFGHHMVDEHGHVGAANLDACSVGIAVLNGDRSGADIPDGDRQGVWDHLAAHLKDAGREAPPLKSESDQPVDASGEPATRGSAASPVVAAVSDDYLPLVRAEVQALGSPLAHSRLEALAPGRRSSGGDASDGPVAVIPLRGVITPRGSMLAALLGLSGGGLLAFRDAFRAAVANDNVKAIVLDIDSPGGLVALVTETAAEIRDARGSKPITAVANTQAGSAAYWIASQADEVVVTPSGQVGSIGALMIHEDISAYEQRLGIKTTLIAAGRYKTEGSPYEPLSRAALQSLQQKVNDIYSIFVNDVAAGRKTTPAAVEAGYGQGSMVLAAKAKQLGMVDRIESLEQALARLGANDADEDQAPADLDGDDDEGVEDELEARGGGRQKASVLYGEARREQPAWHL